MNDTSQELNSNDFTVDVSTAIEVLGVTQPRLSQLTTRGSLSAMRKKVGGRNRLFYNKHELVQYVQSNGIQIELSNILFADTFNLEKTVISEQKVSNIHVHQVHERSQNSNLKLNRNQMKDAKPGLLRISAKSLSQNKKTEIQVLETLKKLHAASQLNAKNDESVKLELCRIKGKLARSLIDNNTDKVALKQLESKLKILEYRVQSLLSISKANILKSKKLNFKKRKSRCRKLKTSVRRCISV